MAPPKGKSKKTSNSRATTSLNPEAPVYTPAANPPRAPPMPAPAVNHPRAPPMPAPAVNHPRAPPMPAPAVNHLRAPPMPAPAVNHPRAPPMPTPALPPSALNLRTSPMPALAVNPRAPPTPTPAVNPPSVPQMGEWSPLSDGIGSSDPLKRGLSEQEINRHVEAALYGKAKSSLPGFEKLCRKDKE